MFEVKHLSKTYKTGRGIIDLSFKVAPGEIYGLLGPNGAGKTTLLKVASGLLNSDQGQCVIDGDDHLQASVQYKSKMTGMIGDTVLYDYLTPMDHLKLMEIHRPTITLEEKEQVLKEMDLLPYKDEKTKQFSTGMKQRLAFAMCLVVKPKVLLLDEPFSGLDIEGKVLIRNRLLQMRQEGQVAVIISSHLIHDLEEIATSAGVIREGRLVDEQAVSEILRHHRNLEDYFVKRTVEMKEGA